MGEDLLEKGAGNVKGHFEDKEFLRLHRRILAENNLDYLVYGDQPIDVSQSLRDKANCLVRQRSHLNQWGWKEPRSTLLLDMWKEIIPQLKILLIYRPCGEVVDSLLRREFKINWNRFRVHYLKYSRLNIPLIIKLSSVWARYNMTAINVARKFPEDALIFRLDDVLKYSTKIAELINEIWRLELTPVDIKNVYDSELIKNRKSTALPGNLLSSCRRVNSELEELRAHSLAQICL